MIDRNLEDVGFCLEAERCIDGTRLAIPQDTHAVILKEYKIHGIVKYIEDIPDICHFFTVTNVEA